MDVLFTKYIPVHYENQFTRLNQHTHQRIISLKTVIIELSLITGYKTYRTPQWSKAEAGGYPYSA